MVSETLNVAKNKETLAKDVADVPPVVTDEHDGKHYRHNISRKKEVHERVEEA